MNIKDYVMGNRLFILLKGESGTGKSIQAGSFPNVYFFDFDKRIGSVINHFRKLGKEDIDFDHYDIKDIEKALDKVGEWQRKGCPYDTIVLDTTTTLISSILFYVDKQKGMTGSKDKSTFGMEVKLGVIRGTALDDYKFLLSGMKQFIYGLKEINDAHVIFNSHIVASEKTDMQGNTTIQRLILAPGKTAAEIPLHFDEIYHLDVEDPVNRTQDPRSQRILLTESTGMDFARTALGLPKTINVTDKLLYDTLKEYHPGIGQNLKKVRKPLSI